MGCGGSTPSGTHSPSHHSSGALVELRIGHALTWEEARQQAEREAGGLPTCDELRKAGVSAGDSVDLWMPVQRADGRQGDYCQIGDHPRWTGRYISHVDTSGVPKWHKTKKDAPWRPGPNSKTCKGVFYARAKGSSSG